MRHLDARESTLAKAGRNTLEIKQIKLFPYGEVIQRLFKLCDGNEGKWVKERNVCSWEQSGDLVLPGFCPVVLRTVALDSSPMGCHDRVGTLG